jgi:hypothetical protein
MRNAGMQQGSHEPSGLAAVRVISTPVPPRRLFGALGVQLRAVYDDLLAEPVPGRLLALLDGPDGALASPQPLNTLPDGALASSQPMTSLPNGALASAPPDECSSEPRARLRTDDRRARRDVARKDDERLAERNDPVRRAGAMPNGMIPSAQETRA